MIGDRIKEVRLALGLTQEELGHRANVAHKQIWRYENHKTTPDAGVLGAIARALDVSTDFLIGLSDLWHPVGEAGLSETERAVIGAMRSGDQVTAIRIITTTEPLET